jgi:hypothetical protein
MSRYSLLKLITDADCHLDVKYPSPNEDTSERDEDGNIVSMTFNNKIVGLCWKNSEKNQKIIFPGSVRAIIDPINDLLIVCGNVGIAKPNNAVAINPNGEIDHKIVAPKFSLSKIAFHTENGTSTTNGWNHLSLNDEKRHLENFQSDFYSKKIQDFGNPEPIEAIQDVRIFENRIYFTLEFGYTWLENRFYEPSKRQWQEIKGAHRA